MLRPSLLSNPKDKNSKSVYVSESPVGAVSSGPGVQVVTLDLAKLLCTPVHGEDEEPPLKRKKELVDLNDRAVVCPRTDCLAEYFGSRALQRVASHKILHDKPDVYQCALCHHISPNKYSLDQHYKFEHQYARLPDSYLDAQKTNRTIPITHEKSVFYQKRIKQLLELELKFRDRAATESLLELRARNKLRVLKGKIDQEIEEREKLEEEQEKVLRKLKDLKINLEKETLDKDKSKKEKEREREDFRRRHWRACLQEKWEKEKEEAAKKKKAGEQVEKKEGSNLPEECKKSELYPHTEYLTSSVPIIARSQLDPASFSWGNSCWERAAKEEEEYLLAAKQHFWNVLFHHSRMEEVD